MFEECPTAPYADPWEEEGVNGKEMEVITDMTVNELVVTMSGDLYLIKVNSMYTPIVIPLARENKVRRREGGGDISSLFFSCSGRP